MVVYDFIISKKVGDEIISASKGLNRNYATLKEADSLYPDPKEKQNIKVLEQGIERTFPKDENGILKIKTLTGEIFRAKSLILNVDRNHKLDENLIGNTPTYCNLHENYLLKGDLVGVIGDRSDAERASKFFSKYARQISTDIYSAKQEVKFSKLKQKVPVPSRAHTPLLAGATGLTRNFVLAGLLMASVAATGTLAGCGDSKQEKEKTQYEQIIEKKEIKIQDYEAKILEKNLALGKKEAEITTYKEQLVQKEEKVEALVNKTKQLNRQVRKSEIKNSNLEKAVQDQPTQKVESFVLGEGDKLKAYQMEINELRKRNDQLEAQLSVQLGDYKIKVTKKGDKLAVLHEIAETDPTTEIGRLRERCENIVGSVQYCNKDILKHLRHFK